MLMALLILATAPRGATFACTPVAVYDGDGPLWCAEGPRIRLSGIAARELDNIWRTNHPCPRASAVQARNELVRLLGGARGERATGHIAVSGPKLRCISRGSGGWSRIAALCSAPGIGDLSCAMVRTGTVLRWRRYGGDRLCR